MPTQANPSHNLNALLIGTAEFSFSEDAASATAAKLLGYRDFGNLKAFTPNTDSTKQDHQGSYRGIRRKDKSVVTEQKLEYTLKADQWDSNLLAILFGTSAGTNFTQALLAAVAGGTWVFSSTTPSDVTKWYDIYTAGGVRVRNLTACTLAAGSALAEGTDYELDLFLGRVRFLTVQTATVTPTISCPAITSSSEGYFVGLKPLQNLTRTGYGRLIVFDQYDSNIVVLDHQDFSCEVQVDSTGEVSGTDFTEITIKVTVTADVGNLLVRRANTLLV